MLSNLVAWVSFVRYFSGLCFLVMIFSVPKFTVATQAQTALPGLVQAGMDEAKSGCEHEHAVMKLGFLTERDINGDGVKDYILDYGMFECGGN